MTTVTQTINSFLTHDLPGELANVLTTGENWKAMQAIPDPWEEEEPLHSAPPPPPLPRDEPSEDTAWMTKGGPLVVGGAAAIPTQDHDSLLSSVRGRWKRPLTLQRKDFEARFAMKERRVVPVEEVLADLRAGKHATVAAMARYYGKPSSWIGCSFMWFLIREKLVSDTATFHGYFPKRPASKNPRQRMPKPSTQPSGSPEPFRLPSLDDETDY
jgi:hypothetical protein